MKLSIIIPVYNEEKTISQLLRLVIAAELPASIKKEIIVIDDGSTDKTNKILSELKSKSAKFKVFSHLNNQGKGAAVRTGLKQSTGDVMIIQDADLEYSPKDYAKLLQPILQGEQQVVYGTRLKNYPLRFRGSNKTVLPTHLLANRFLTTVTNLLYGSNLTDMETCYKVFAKKVIEDIELQSDGFDFEPELTAKILKKGIRIFEIPIITKPRTYSEGKKIGFTDGIIAIWALFKYRFTN